jgi:DNA-binding NarL/FixJ family response regulator
VTAVKRYSVIIVDDSEISRSVLKAGIRQFKDIEIRIAGVARNGKEGVWLAKTARPDVVTLDLDMPDMDGLSCLMELLAENPALRIIVISNLAHTDQAKECLVYGAKKVLSKQTLTVRQLEDAIAEVLADQIG